MNNLRKVKRKRKNRVLNTEQTAQQKLFEISRFSDQEEFNQSDHFLSNLSPKRTYEHFSPKKHLSTQSSIANGVKEKRKIQVINATSLNELRQKCNLNYFKKPLSITNYLLIDQRDKKSIYDSKSKPPTFDYSSIIKKKNQKGIKGNHSCDLKRQVKKQGFVLNKCEVGPAMQIKNIRLFSKYPTFFSH